MKKLIITLFMATALTASADTDLSALTDTIRLLRPVSGARIESRPGPAINPTPKSARFSGSTVDIGRGFTIASCPVGIPRSIPVVTEGGMPLSVTVTGEGAPGSYSLSATPERVTVEGADADGAFYGLQTLRQLIDGNRLALAEITDEPALARRGVVEGFYGNPWSHAKRMSLMEFMGANKLNAYLYGPKDDPYHSSPNWRKPYPEAQAAELRELVDAARRNHVRFIWAIHPGRDIRWDKADYDSLVGKFSMMYDLGVRDFALFFDDIEGAGANPERQSELLNRLTREFVARKGDVGSLIMCPTDYSGLWANPTERGSLAYFGRTLDKSIDVFWTGDFVCSDLTPKTLEFVDTRIRRPALYWWNFPVTDYARHIVMQGPVYGLDPTVDATTAAGIVSNPMEHAEASKAAIYSVADYAWNPAAYNALDSWERALADMMPECADAYRTFAIHSCDTETGYRRDESWNLSMRSADSLRVEMERLKVAPATIRRLASNRALVDELDPWLTQAEALAARVIGALDLLEKGSSMTDAEYAEAYAALTMTEAEREAYVAHKVGTLRLQPFYEAALRHLASRRKN